MLVQDITKTTSAKIVLTVLALLGVVFIVPKDADASVIFDSDLIGGTAWSYPNGTLHYAGSILNITVNTQIDGFSFRQATGGTCSGVYNYGYTLISGVTSTVLASSSFTNTSLGCVVASDNETSSVSFGSSVVLTPGYYFFGVQGRGGAGSPFSFAGSGGSDVVPNVCSDNDFWASGSFDFTDCNPSASKDFAFKLYGGSGIYASSRILSVYSPRSNSIVSTGGTSSANVNFNYSFFNRDDYSIAGVHLENYTSGISVNTSDIEYNFAATGVGFFNETKNLSEGLYRWRPYIRNSSNEFVYGGYVFFRVGSLEDNFVEYQTDFTSSESSGYVEFDFSDRCDDYFGDSGSWLSITTYGRAFARGICNGFGAIAVPASTSLQEFRNSALSITNYFPVSTVTSIYDITVDILTVDNIASDSRYASLSFTNLDFDTTVSHSVTFTLYRMASLSEYIPQSSIDLARNTIKYFMWFSFCVGWIYVLAKLFKLS